jgi:hypothetical protein
MFSIGDLVRNFMAGKFNNHPLMQQYNKMMAGKTPEQQAQTLLNLARSKGIDPNAKIFSEQDLKMFGLK